MNIEQLIQEAIAAIKEGSFELASQLLLKALSIAQSQINPQKEIKVLHCFVNLHLQQGSYVLAENTANQSLEIALKISDRSLIYKSLYNLGLSRYWQEKYDLAIEAYQEALRYIDTNNPDCWLVWNGLGETYYWQNNYDGALNACHRALELASDNARQSTSQFNLGQTYYWAGNYFQAIACLQKSLELDPENSRKIKIFNIPGAIALASDR